MKSSFFSHFFLLLIILINLNRIQAAQLKQDLPVSSLNFESHFDAADNFTEERDSRSFPFLAVVKVPNAICTSNGQQGSCKSNKQCSKEGGTVLAGSCGNGYGVCCMVSVSCSATNSGTPTRVPSSGSHIVNPPSYVPPLQCQFILPRKTGICQVRLDFVTFILSQPNDNGDCTGDSMTISGADNLRNFITCGTNTGQQLYLQYGSSDSISVNLNLVNPMMSYDILVNYIECPAASTNSQKRKGRSFSNSNKSNKNNLQSSSSTSNDNIIDPAPNGCAQYYTTPSGIVQSFNYMPLPATGNPPQVQINNEQYMVCIKTPPGSTKITWTVCDQGTFFVSGGFEFPPSTQCETDYVDIPGSELGRYCGTSFPPMVTSYAKPFLMYVNFNDQEMFGTNFPVDPTTGCPAGSQCYVLGVPVPPVQPPAVAPCSSASLNPGQCHADPYIMEMSDFYNIGFCLRYTIS